MGKRTLPIGLKPTTIVAEVPRCLRKDCGRLFAFSPFIQRLARSFADYTEGISLLEAPQQQRHAGGPQPQDQNHVRQTFGRRGEGCCMLRLHALHQAHDKFIG